MYRTPQRPAEPLEEIERITVPRYGRLHMGVMLVFGLGCLLWLPVARLQGTNAGYAVEGTFALMGAILVAIVLVLRRDHTVLEANYTRGELVIRPFQKPELRVALAHIEYLDMSPQAKSDEMLLHLVTTGGGRIHVMNTAAVNEPIDWVQKVVATVAQRAEAAQQAAAQQV